MKVYTAMWYSTDYDEHLNVDGVFSTPEAATAHLDKRHKQHLENGWDRPAYARGEPPRDEVWVFTLDKGPLNSDVALHRTALGWVKP